MYEHPIKRAGLAFNRILLSNTRMVAAAFPGADMGKYRLQYKMKFYEGGKETHRKYVNLTNIDEVFPVRKWALILFHLLRSCLKSTYSVFRTTKCGQVEKMQSISWDI